MQEVIISPTFVLLNIIGAVCLMLWGIRMVRKGITRAFGHRLRSVISHSVKNRMRSFLAGIGVTSILQSSTATTMVVSSFVGKGLVPVSAGLAIVLGADVGSTLIAQVLSFDFSWLAPLFMLVGFGLYTKYDSGGLPKYIGRFLMGLAFILFSLQMIALASVPMKESQMTSELFSSLGEDSFFILLLAALLTWLCHSSLAIVLLVVSLVGQAVIPLQVGLVMVLGANLGNMAPPLIAGLKEGALASRIPAGNLMMRFVGVLVAFPLLGMSIEWLSVIDERDVRLVVNYHTAFNLVVGLFFLPLTGYVAKIVEGMFPQKIDLNQPGQAIYLDENSLDTPPIALASASRETLRMGDLTERMLRDWMEGFKRDNEGCLKRIAELDDVVDELYGQIKHYVAKVSLVDMDHIEAQKQVQIITFATNLEHIGDIVDTSLVPLAKKKVLGNKRLSKDGFAEISDMFQMVIENARLAQHVFLSEDVRLARKLRAAKNIFEELEGRAAAQHMTRLREGVPETLQTSSIHMDIIRDLKRINEYFISVAYSVIEANAGLEELAPAPIPVDVEDVE